jgi:hypothetical protein
VKILSIEIPTTGRVFKESVKVCTPKSPPFSDDFALNFATFYVFPHCSRAQTEKLGGLPNGIESIIRWQRRSLYIFQRFSNKETEFWVLEPPTKLFTLGSLKLRASL